VNRQQIRKIKEYAEKLLQLCSGEPLPSHKTSGNGHWWSGEPNAIAAAEPQGKAARAYHKKVLDILGDGSEDWVFIRRTFENLKPGTFSSLKEMRQKILLHTDVPEKGGSWLESQGGNFGPNEHLRHEIERLADELLQVVKTEGKKKRRNARGGKAGGKSEPPILVPGARGREGRMESENDGQGGTKTEREKRERITLQQFFKDYCDLSSRPDIASKREMLLREHREERIKLPLVGKKKDYRKGQTYLFWLDELLNKWPTYQETLTTLPSLKKTGNK